MPDIKPTTRAYTVKLSGDGDWRNAIWQTHLVVNRGARVWADWLLTLRGGLPASLADAPPDRRVLLALSWLSVESPVSLVPNNYLVAAAKDKDRQQKVVGRFDSILDRLQVADRDAWRAACEPAFTARIRDDACWVDRSAAFLDLQGHHAGLTADWAAATFFELIGGADTYFAMPDADSAEPAEAKDFVQKAGGWLSRNWGSGEKSDAGAIADCLSRLAGASAKKITECTGTQALSELLSLVDGQSTPDADPQKRFKQLKQAIGWKGRPSKGAMALEKLADADIVSADLWEQTRKKLLEEASDQSAKGGASSTKPEWMPAWREQMESLLAMPYRTDKDLIWESGVMLDHALRRVSAAHTWIKRAEVERRQFRADAENLASVPKAAREWLDSFCESRSDESNSRGEYLIRKRAIDGWDKIAAAWDALDESATAQDRLGAARDIQRDLDDNEKFGDIQLFEGLADDVARCVWQDERGKTDPAILRNYSSATVAEHNQRRFKVPAYRHPDPLRHPVFVDFGNSRWGITYSALKAAQQIAKAKTEPARQRLQSLTEPSALHGVTLGLWTGENVESVSLRWHGKRLWKDLNLASLGQSSEKTATRADRLGRAVAGQPQGGVEIAEVFGQKDWNGRLQAPRRELDHLADLIYGKHAEADFAQLDPLDVASLPASARRRWEHLNWFLTTSAKLKPQGPWLDYVCNGLPDGIEYKTGRKGSYLHYAANQGRKGRTARLQLARLPGLRVLSLDLGHRYAAACAVWETLSKQQMEAACRDASQTAPHPDQLYLHLQRKTQKVQKSGRRKGQPIVETTIYRRIGNDLLPDGTPHPAPWARLDRQFLIKLQGEGQSARVATAEECVAFERLCTFIGLKNAEPPVPPATRRIDELREEATKIAKRGLRRLADVARIAYIVTASRKPLAGGRMSDPLTREQRVEYVLDGLLLWQELAQSSDYKDEWAKQQWDRWVIEKLGGPQPVEVADELTRSERKKRLDLAREPLRKVAEQLADASSETSREIGELWTAEWRRRSEQWRRQLRWLRRFILPRIGKRPSGSDAAAFAGWKQGAKAVRGTGGLSLRRLRTIRNLYEVLKAFRMRPEPDDLRKNVPVERDESLARFGHRILNQLERLREQRIKQLASRIVEAALGVGSEDRTHWNGRKRPIAIGDKRFAPCHAVVVENLENYLPEETRLRRENRQLMNWAARNVRKYILEGCELHGLLFAEVSPKYTSKQDSRTGAPGVRCEEIRVSEVASAVRGTITESAGHTTAPSSRSTRFLAKDLHKVRAKAKQKGRDPLDARDQVLLELADAVTQWPDTQHTLRVPKRGGEIFVSADRDSPAAKGIQADLNAAANIGLKALLDPDWIGAWWFVLIEVLDAETGRPNAEKVKGCSPWIASGDISLHAAPVPTKSSRSKRNKTRTATYAWNPLHWHPDGAGMKWHTTNSYWRTVDAAIAEHLLCEMLALQTLW